MSTVITDRDGEAVPGVSSPRARQWLAGVALSLGTVLPTAAALADERAGSFDPQTLAQRGIDPQLANLLLEAPRFTAGRHALNLSVNGQRRGRVDVVFNGQGVLCFNQPLLDAGHLRVPPDNAECHAFLEAYPQTVIEQDPATLSLSLVVPTDALRPTVRDVSGYQTGGFAGLLNYDLSGLYNEFGDDTSRFGSANTEVGFNAGDWIVRSRQVRTWQDKVSRTTHLDAYAQRTFAEQQAVFQAGQINLYNPVLAGAQITGAQVLTETALQDQNQGATITGIANSPAQVEIRQNGTLIHSTVVPAGPFSLTDVRRLNSRSDVEVTVKESSGEERRFTVPAAMLGLGLPAPGYSVAAGRVRKLGAGEGAEPWVVSGGWSGALHPQVSVGAGVLGAEDYRAAGASLAWLPWQDSQFQASSQAAQATRNGNEQGVQTDLSWSQRLGERWAITTAGSWRSLGYRDLEDSTYTTETREQRRSRYRDQQSATASWSHPMLGAFSAGISRSSSFTGESSSRALASWGTSFGRVSVSASAEWQVGGRQQSDDSVYLNISVPLGESRRGRAWARNAGGDHRIGAGVSEQINDQLSYQVGVERDSRDREVESSIGVSTLPYYSQLDFNYTRNNQERSSYQGGARGGVVLHGEGLTFSPYPVRETFALMSVGDMAGIKVSTPSGPVWTDWQGQAVVSQLSPYGRSPVEVHTRSLPRNADISNGLAVLSAGRGAVDKVKFGVALTRRALLNVTDAKGQPLPRGAAISTADGEFVTLVQEGSQVFLPDVLDRRELWVSAPGRPRCRLDFDLPERGDPEVYYETAPARCLP
ncbi:fimbria/pilus outer membrane usher protein [Pseudomonas tolaasii]|uniref:Fimbria/pilus outer membrane usher protein n=2 Tax=Pseudomonas tolaasii TaxID=29442 RepID=A0A7Y8AW03_PSETO|nr:fimbria/pilus outer membrane usher protein [Pseudomonas tolaasii]ARB26337.1 outer membrane usher protein [Pseudomonas tolaasii]KAB0476175.1 fimbria/pilus outer membrane usher protein [Pseudomonas tolaasii]MBY8939619.1 fimbria/pilus outer membrane usher protein [Pseudomonas tolaasii]NWC24331.1 fimbria/pilus outer membrane usher protein [Pseudomonas tolaasii]NWC39323.1 fimbria/pilus outer membrane usher protein [Pseudomonas tolaasii]